jgi:ribosomal protein S12 methylthiotransferase accessory factor YcaO
MRQDGLEQAVAVDMTQPELDVPVVRVVVPRAETWSTFRLHTTRGTFGPRVAKVLAHRDSDAARHAL